MVKVALRRVEMAFIVKFVQRFCGRTTEVKELTRPLLSVVVYLPVSLSELCSVSRSVGRCELEEFS